MRRGHAIRHGGIHPSIQAHQSAAPPQASSRACVQACPPRRSPRTPRATAAVQRCAAAVHYSAKVPKADEPATLVRAASSSSAGISARKAANCCSAAASAFRPKAANSAACVPLGVERESTVAKRVRTAQEANSHANTYSMRRSRWRPQPIREMRQRLRERRRPALSPAAARLQQPRVPHAAPPPAAARGAR